MQHKPPKEEKLYCRSWSANYLGVTSNALKSYPIPFIQYSRFGYALYKLSDLRAFKEKSIHNPVIEQGGIRVPDEKGAIREHPT